MAVSGFWPRACDVVTSSGGTSLLQRPEWDGAIVTICDRSLSLTSKHTVMGLFKKFGASSEAVKLGRKHAVGLAMDMPGRVAADYRAAGVASGPPKFRAYDPEVSVRKREVEENGAGVERRGSEGHCTRFS